MTASEIRNYYSNCASYFDQLGYTPAEMNVCSDQKEADETDFLRSCNIFREVRMGYPHQHRCSSDQVPSPELKAPMPVHWRSGDHSLDGFFKLITSSE